MFGFTIPLIISWLWIFTFIATHISLSVVVYKDADKNYNSAFGISPVLWFGISFSLPILGFFIYWLMNYSTLSRKG